MRSRSRHRTPVAIRGVPNEPHAKDGPSRLAEVAIISPPDGTVLYVLQGMRRDGGAIGEVFTGVLPFVAVYILAIVVLMAVPGIALWLPSWAGP